jgi:hypothetical protein
VRPEEAWFALSANGQGDILSVTISPEVIDPQDPEMLEDLVLAAVNEALRLSKELANQRMGQLAGGMGLNVPGSFRECHVFTGAPGKARCAFREISRDWGEKCPENGLFRSPPESDLCTGTCRSLG